MEEYYHLYLTNTWDGKSFAFTYKALRPGEKLNEGSFFGVVRIGKCNVRSLYTRNGVYKMLPTNEDPRAVAAYDFMETRRRGSTDCDTYVIIDHRAEGIKEWG